MLSKDELYRARAAAVISTNVRIRLLDDIDKLRDLLQEAVDVTEERHSLAAWRANIQKVLDD